MSPRKSLTLSLIAAGLLAMFTPASAALVSVGQSAFSAGATVVTFEDLPGNTAIVPAGYGSGVGLALSTNTRSLEYSGYGSTLAMAATTASLGAMAATWGVNGARGTGFSLATAQDLVGFSISSNVDITDTVISAYLGSTLLGSQTVSFAADTIGFVGFEDLAGIDRIVIGNSTNCMGNCIHQLDNVTFEQRNTVPEPMSLALVGFGLLGLVLSRRGQGQRS